MYVTTYVHNNVLITSYVTEYSVKKRRRAKGETEKEVKEKEGEI